MKNLCIFLMMSTLQLGFSQGINFVSSDTKWNDVLAKAKMENKLIFVDVYTTWCGPCKAMDKNVFPLKDVGAFYNAQFINVKIDAEKGEGIDIANKYNVRSFPTYLFIDGNGKLVHKDGNSMSADKFIVIGKTALDPKGQFAASQKQFAQGGNSQEWLVKFSMKCREVGESRLAEDVAYSFIQGEKDKSSKDICDYACLFVQSTNSDLFKFIAQNRADFDKHMGAKFMTNLIEKTIYFEVIRLSFNQGNKKFDVEKAVKHLKTLNLTEEAIQKIMDMLIIQEHTNNRDVNNFIKTTVAYYEKYSHDEDERLSASASAFAEITDDATLLQKALKWSTESIDINPRYIYFRTAALLNIKLGNRQIAKEYADKGAVKAKEQGLKNMTAEVFLRDVDELYYLQKRDTLGYLKVKMAYFDTHTSEDAHDLNTAAIDFYEKTNDKSQLEKALTWALKSIEIFTSWSNLNTAATLYYKLGNKEKAKEYADRAIVKGKQMNKNFELTEALLKKIEAMK
jgi:thiol-disulfide isomerase/thioredoxin/tetratricopeptide (TPR) repeat protein